MGNQQTAVEWLAEKLRVEFGFVFSDNILEQAKEIEKEQMRSASCPYIVGWEDGEFEYWYNEIYKNE